MGRQLGVIQYRGKLGQTVGMRNGFGGSQAFNREYVASNSSESDAQILQRVRMLPAVNFRRQLEQVISRAWQGVKYGGPSTREFMRYALREPLANIPQLVKEDPTPWPGEYLISKGSLQKVIVNYNAALQAWDVVGTFGIEGNTMGEVNAEFIRAGLAQEGDQITVIQVGDVDQGDQHWPTYVVRSWQCDPTDATTYDEFNSQSPCQISPDEGTETPMTFSLKNSDSMACAIVISRETSSGPRRSTSTMVVRKDVYPELYASTLKEAVKKSYQKTTSTRQATDWPYDPDGDITEDSAIDGTYTVTGLTGNNAVFNGSVVKVKRWENSGDLAKVYVKRPSDPPYAGTAPFCVGTNEQVILKAVSMEETAGLSLSLLSELSSLPQILLPGN